MYVGDLMFVEVYTGVLDFILLKNNRLYFLFGGRIICLETGIFF
jgi:hypothetical protein